MTFHIVNQAAQSTADLSAISGLAPIFAFILVFVVAFAVLRKSELLGQHVFFDIIVSFIIGAVFATVTGAREVILGAVPWFAILLMALFFILMLTSFVSQDAVPKKFLVWLFLIGIIVVFFVIAGSVFGSTVASYVPGPFYGENADPGLLFFFDWFWSPPVIGAFWLAIAAIVVGFILIKWG